MSHSTVVPYTQFVQVSERRQRVRQQVDQYIVEGPDGQCRRVDDDTVVTQPARDTECGTGHDEASSAEDEDPDVI
jgi:hypothetical protein